MIRTPFLSMILISTLCISTTSLAGIISGGSSPDGGGGFQATDSIIAAEFSVSGTTDIVSAGVYVGDFTQEIDTWDSLGNPLEWFIFEGGANHPTVGAAPVASGVAQNLVITNSGVNWFDANSNLGNAYLAEFNFGSVFTAEASTRYWLGIHLANDYTEGISVFWATGAPRGNHAIASGGDLNLWDNGSPSMAFYLSTSAIPAVPVPAPAWLFSSGLLGLIGIARRKKD